MSWHWLSNSPLSNLKQWWWKPFMHECFTGVFFSYLAHLYITDAPCWSIKVDKKIAFFWNIIHQILQWILNIMHIKISSHLPLLKSLWIFLKSELKANNQIKTNVHSGKVWFGNISSKTRYDDHTILLKFLLKVSGICLMSLVATTQKIWKSWFGDMYWLNEPWKSPPPPTQHTHTLLLCYSKFKITHVVQTLLLLFGFTDFPLLFNVNLEIPM